MADAKLTLVSASPHCLKYRYDGATDQDDNSLATRTQAQMLVDLGTPGTELPPPGSAPVDIAEPPAVPGAGPLRALLAGPDQTTPAGQAAWNGLPAGPHLSLYSRAAGPGGESQALRMAFFQEPVGVNALLAEVLTAYLETDEIHFIEVRFNHSIDR